MSKTMNISTLSDLEFTWINNRKISNKCPYELLIKEKEDGYIYLKIRNKKIKSLIRKRMNLKKAYYLCTPMRSLLCIVGISLDIINSEKRDYRISLLHDEPNKEQYSSDYICNQIFDIRSKSLLNWLTEYEKLEDLQLIETYNTIIKHEITMYLNRYYSYIGGSSSVIVKKIFKNNKQDFILIPPTCFTNEFQNIRFSSLSLMKPSTSKKSHHIVTNNNTTSLNVATIWLQHKLRKTFSNGMDFSESTDENTYNLWHGIQVSEDKEVDISDADPIFKHIKDIWCCGDELSYQYVIHWIAHILQKPFQKTGVALVLQSRQGAGKGIIINKIGELFSQYFKSLRIEDIHTYTKPLADCLLLFLDETVYSSDKRIAARLKSLITEPYHQITEKFVPSFTMKNNLNIILASNYEHCAPLEQDDRRYFVLRLDDKYSGRPTDESTKYFKAISNVSLESLYKAFFEIDISNFDPKRYPITDAIRLQKEFTMDSITQWWLECLREGEVLGYIVPLRRKDEERNKDIEEEEEYRPFGERIEKQYIYDAYRKWMETVGKKNKKSHPEAANRFWPKLKTMCPSIIERKRSMHSREVILPSLPDARKEFNKYTDDVKFIQPDREPISPR